MKTAKRWIFLGAAVGLTVGCWRHDPDHCGSNLGDASCGEGMFCNACEAENNGCVSERPSLACHVVGEGMDDAESPGSSSGTTGTESGSEASAGGSTTGDPGSSSTTGPECTEHGQCQELAAPLCNPSGECVSCEEMADPDGACAELDPARPVCEAGVCVQCTPANAGACVGQTPVCGDGNACTACTEHDQCPESACHLDGADAGACFDVAEVVPIANTGELTAAIASLGAMGRAVFVLEPGTYNVTILLGASTEVAILGKGTTVLAGNSPRAVDVYQDAIVYLDGVQVVNGSGSGIVCDSASVWLDDGQVRNNSALGLDISGGCAVRLRRAAVRANPGGGMDLSGVTSTLAMRNSLVSDNVGPAAIPGIRAISSQVEITYSVIVSNGTFAAPDNLECLSGASGSVRNSIIAGPAADSIVTCGALTWGNNAVDTAGLGASNTDVGNYNGAWFISPGMGNYRLTSTGETVFDGIALWQDGDPITDIDGDPIPTEGPSFPGYDQP